MHRIFVILAAAALPAAPVPAEAPKAGVQASRPFSQFERTPLPPQRPKDLASPPPSGDALSYAPTPPPRDATLPKAEADASCSAVLNDANLVTVARPAIWGEGGCGISAPVSLQAVILQDGRRVEVSPTPVMRCDMAARLGAFIRETVAPATEAYGGKIKRVITADAYDCRGRNRQVGAKLSEHAFGGAIDLSAIEFEGGKTMRITDRANDPAIASALKDSACARFATVLGPGSDGYHEDHVHLDLAQRRNGYKICQWVQR